MSKHNVYHSLLFLKFPKMSCFTTTFLGVQLHFRDIPLLGRKKASPAATAATNTLSPKLIRPVLLKSIPTGIDKMCVGNSSECHVT